MPNSTINATTNGLNSTAGNVATLDLQVAGSTVASVGSTGISVTGTVSATGVSSFPAGSNTAPSITFTGDTNTGIYSPAADTIAFTEGGSEAMRINSSGNVGIGTSSPGAKLEVAGGFRLSQTGTTPAGLDVGLNGNNGVVNISCRDSSSNWRHLYLEANILSFFTGTVTERLRINADGRMLLGTTSDGTGNPIFRATGGSNIVAFGSGQGMRILSSGEDNFTINTWTNTPNPNFLLGYGNGSGSVDTSKERVTVNAGTWAFQNSNLSISGSLSKGSGSFKINHPLPAKTDTHFLVHSFIESPQADLIYRGKIQLQNGIATVNIDTAAGMTDGTFVLLCRDVQCFTSNESDWDAVRGSVSGNILTIECQNSNSNATISWMVIGERQDPHMYETDWTDNNGRVIVEPEKKIEDDQNLYFSGVVENA